MNENLVMSSRKVLPLSTAIFGWIAAFCGGVTVGIFLAGALSP